MSDITATPAPIASKLTAPSLRLGAISLRSAAAAALLPRSVGNVAGARRCREYPAGPVVKIYTRKGDDGSTGLWYGGRVPKSGGRPEAYGAVDEAASALGLCRAAATGADEELATDILRIQNELFVAGAELATAPEASERLEAGVSKVTSEMVDRLESDIDRYMDRVDLPPKFVIPGGSELSARLDVARTAVRRAERRVVDLKAAGDLPDDTALRYLNRLSDALFAMARYADEPNPKLFEGRT
jgi:cob(I)alamin adenosyltransferase